MLYTDKIRREVRKVPVPHSFLMEIVEYSEIPPPFILLRFYYSQWSTFADSEKIRCAEYLENVRLLLKSYGVDATIDPVYDLPTPPRKGQFV